MPLRPGKVRNILKATVIGHDEQQLAERLRVCQLPVVLLSSAGAAMIATGSRICNTACQPVTAGTLKPAKHSLT